MNAQVSHLYINRIAIFNLEEEIFHLKQATKDIKTLKAILELEYAQLELTTMFACPIEDHYPPKA